MNIEQLRNRILAETSTLQRVQERVRVSMQAAEKSQAELDRGLDQLKQDAVVAILEDRPSPGLDLKKKLVTLQNEAHHAGATLDAAQTALRLQRAKVEELNTELADRRMEVLRVEVKDVEKELLEHIQAVVNIGARIQDIARLQGVDAVTLAREIFPSIRSEAERTVLLNVLNCALQHPSVLYRAQAA